MKKAKPIQVTSKDKNARKYVTAHAGGDNIPRPAYVETIEKYLNKNGTPSKRALRSRKAREEYNKAVSEFNKARQKGEISALNKAIGKSTARVKSGAKRGKMPAKQARKIDYAEIARQATQDDSKTARQVRDEIINKIKDEVNIGSDLINRLASDKSITTDDFYKIIGELYDSITNGMPADVREDVTKDEAFDAIMKYHETIANGGDIDADLLVELLNSADNIEATDIALDFVDNYGLRGADFDLSALGEALQELETDVDIYDLSNDQLEKLLQDYLKG